MVVGMCCLMSFACGAHSEEWKRATQIRRRTPSMRLRKLRHEKKQQLRKLRPKRRRQLRLQTLLRKKLPPLPLLPRQKRRRQLPQLLLLRRRLRLITTIQMSSTRMALSLSFSRLTLSWWSPSGWTVTSLRWTALTRASLSRLSWTQCQSARMMISGGSCFPQAASLPASSFQTAGRSLW